MSARPRWILEFDPDFPAPERLAPWLPDAVVLEPRAPGAERWPDVPAPHVAYGTMATLTRMRRHAPLATAVFDDYPRLRCSSYWRAVYPMLGRAAVIAPMRALLTLPLARMFGGEVFVRSDTNFKCFAAGRVPVDGVEDFVARHAAWADDLVALSEVVDVGQEYRCVCRGQRVVCHSSYVEEPYRPAPPEVRAFAEEAARRLRDVAGLDMVTVDVATGGDRLRVVEVGGVNSWGIYGGDPRAFIAAMEAEALGDGSDATRP